MNEIKETLSFKAVMSISVAPRELEIFSSVLDGRLVHYSKHYPNYLIYSPYSSI